MNRLKNRMILGAGAALITALALAGCGRPGGGPGGRPAAEGSQELQPLAVEALTVTRGELVRNIEAAGIVSGINEAYVVSETQGIIQSVDFELGDRIPAGQVLVKVDDTIPRLNMEQAREQYEIAKLDLEATERLFDEGSASKAELARARSAVNGSQARYQSALKTYQDCTIRAPIGGYVAGKESGITLGNYLSPGQRVARLVDISSLRAEVAVGESQVGLLAEGAPATVLIPAASRQRVFEAAVSAVSAGSDPSTGSYAVVVTWSNPVGGSVKSGMSATVSIETQAQEPVILIPSAAVVEQGGQSYVFTAEAGRAAQKPVQIGRRIGNIAEVLEGLEEGETLIISGLTALRRGAPVQPSLIGDSGSWQ
ncbi:MAG: efflux RND transporter periplasmic adaptor subunit [Spirochaetales bacterium]|nr:efflux RND transporter periplasmic adaptor subunit [Spirochaetales bacterium]